MAFRPGLCTRDLIGGFVVYAGLLVGSRMVLKSEGLSEPIKMIMAALPILGALLVAFVLLRHVRTMDEMQQKIQLEAFTAAAILVALGSFSIAFLNDAGLPQPSLFWVMPSMLGLHGLILPFVIRRYK